MIASLSFPSTRPHIALQASILPILLLSEVRYVFAMAAQLRSELESQFAPLFAGQVAEVVANIRARRQRSEVRSVKVTWEECTYFTKLENLALRNKQPDDTLHFVITHEGAEESIAVPCGTWGSITDMLEQRIKVVVGCDEYDVFFKELLNVNVQSKASFNR